MKIHWPSFWKGFWQEMRGGTSFRVSLWVMVAVTAVSAYLSFERIKTTKELTGSVDMLRKVIQARDAQ